MADPIDAATLDWAVALVRAAGDRTLRHFRSPDLAAEAKADGTPVTIADRDAERFLRDEIAAAFPADSIVGEEHADTVGPSGRRWVIDPIDGTKAFVRGVPLYANLLALEDADGWAVAVVNLPAAGECVFAGRGLGAFVLDPGGDRGPARVRGDGEPRLLNASGFTHWPDDQLLAVKHAGFQLRTWGDGYGYAMVATGRADAMVDPVAELWDLAPMPLLLAEAGGRFTTLDGSDDPDGGSGVATAGGDAHDSLLALLR